MWPFLHRTYLSLLNAVDFRFRTRTPSKLDDTRSITSDDEDMRREERSITGRVNREVVLERRLRRAKEQITALEGCLAEEKEEATKLKGLVDALQHERHELLQVQRMQRGQVKSLTDAATAAGEEMHGLRGHIQVQQRQIVEGDRARIELAQVKRELEAGRRERKEIESLLQVRTAELRDAQQYLGKPDTVSYADVRRMVEALNAQIFQTAAQVVDEFHFESRRSRVLSGQMSQRCTNIAGLVGAELVRTISAIPHSADPTLVQVMIQAYFARRARDIIEAWATRLSPSCDPVLSQIHRRILHSEPQAVSARWRMLTRRHVDGLVYDAGSREADLCQRVLHGLLRMLTISGVVMPCGERALEDKIRAIFGEKIMSIVERALELQRVIGQEITTTEFMILCPQPELPFNASLMEDMDDAGPIGRVGTAAPTYSSTAILCTTELGLFRRGKKVSGDEGKETWEEIVLLKAKVALPALLEDLTGHASSAVTDHDTVVLPC